MVVLFSEQKAMQSRKPARNKLNITFVRPGYGYSFSPDEKGAMAVIDRQFLRHEINNQLEIMTASTELLRAACTDLQDRTRLLNIQRAIARLKILLDELECKEQGLKEELS
ncbi:MAG TPA: hypothetical protein VFZ99_06100 [Terriglobales bacterium]